MPRQTKMLLFVFALTAMLLISVSSTALAEEGEITGEVQETNDSISPEPMLLDSQEIVDDETVTAENLDMEEPTLLPDSKWYFLKTWRRNIRSLFTFNKVKKAELKLKYASEELLETRQLFLKDQKPEIIEKALERYQNTLGKIKETADRIKETASTSLAIGKFLDKFTKQETLHLQILDKLSLKNMASSTMQRIRETREAHLENFEGVMLKLEENKERVRERLEKNLSELKNLLPNKAQIQNQLEGAKNAIRKRVMGEVCANIWEPVCGKDDKTYANSCWAEQAGIEIAEQGICQGSIVPNTGGAGQSDDTEEPEENDADESGGVGQPEDAGKPEDAGQAGSGNQADKSNSNK